MRSCVLVAALALVGVGASSSARSESGAMDPGATQQSLDDDRRGERARMHHHSPVHPHNAALLTPAP